MENPDGNIGLVLKQRREELGRTLENAEQETRIRKTYLESLENNRFSELPGQTYVTGFIRVYARYLGLKSNPLLARLNDLQNLESEPVTTGPAAGSQPGLRAKPTTQGNRRKFLVAFTLVLVLGCLVYLLTAVFTGDEQVDESATKATATGETPAASAEQQAEAEKSAAAPEKPHTSATGQAQPDAAEDQMPAVVSAPSVAAAGHQVQGHRALPAIPDDGGSLRMLALADSSLIIKVDARQPHQYKLHDGLDLTWKVKQRVNVEFAASDVARFWLNGREIDIAGDQSFTLKPAGE